MGKVGPRRATRSGSPPVAWMPVSVMPVLSQVRVLRQAVNAVDTRGRDVQPLAQRQQGVRRQRALRTARGAREVGAAAVAVFDVVAREAHDAGAREGAEPRAKDPLAEEPDSLPLHLRDQLIDIGMSIGIARPLSRLPVRMSC